MQNEINKNNTNHYHHTKTKGDIGLTKVISDLTEKGYDVFIPVGGEHLPYDLVINANNKLLKIQVKYSINAGISNKYNLNDFDYFAIYNPNHNKFIYPHISYMGKKINFKIPNCANAFYWFEDFLNLTEPGVLKKTYKDFGYEITKSIQKQISDRNQIPKFKSRKVIRPSKEELTKLVWEKPMIQIAKDFGVSDKAIKKWCDSYGIEKPKIGYWNTVSYNNDK